MQTPAVMIQSFHPLLDRCGSFSNSAIHDQSGMFGKQSGMRLGIPVIARDGIVINQLLDICFYLQCFRRADTIVKATSTQLNLL